MAEFNVDNYVKELKNRFLECPICLELFDEEDRHPRILPCLHTYCLACLKKLLREQCLTCSLCNKSYEITDGNLEAFPKDNTRRDLLDFVCVKLEPSKILCENCDVEKQQAVYRCKECSQLLCQQCYDAHQTMKYSKDHNSFRLDSGEPTGENLHEFSRLDTCGMPGHQNESLKLFCQSEGCKKPICFVCAFSDHKNHTTSDVNTVFEEQKQDITKAKDGLLERQKETDLIEKQVEDALRELKDNTEKADQDVITSFDECIAYLEERKQELRDDIKYASEEKEKRLRFQIKELTTFSENVQSGCDFLQQYLSYRNAPKFLQVAPMILERFSNLQKQHIDSKPLETPEFKFERTNMGTHFKTHSLRMGNLPMQLPRIPKTPPPILPRYPKEHSKEALEEPDDDVFLKQEMDKNTNTSTVKPGFLSTANHLPEKNGFEKAESTDVGPAQIVGTEQRITEEVPKSQDWVKQETSTGHSGHFGTGVASAEDANKPHGVRNNTEPETITEEERTKTENVLDHTTQEVVTQDVIKDHLRNPTGHVSSLNGSASKHTRDNEEPQKKVLTKSVSHPSARRKFSSKDDRKGERIRQRPKTPPFQTSNGETQRHSSRYHTLPVTLPSQMFQPQKPQSSNHTLPVTLSSQMFQPQVLQSSNHTLPVTLPSQTFQPQKPQSSNHTLPVTVPSQTFQPQIPQSSTRQIAMPVEVENHQAGKLANPLVPGEMLQRKVAALTCPTFHLDEKTLPRDLCLSENKATLSTYQRGTHHRLLLDQQPNTYVGVIAEKGFKYPENVYFEVEVTYSARRSGHPVVVFELWFSKQEDIDAGQITEDRKYKVTLNNPSKVGEGTVSVNFNGVDVAIPRGKVLLGVNLNANHGTITIVEKKKGTCIGKIKGVDFSQEVWPVFQISKDQTLNATMTLHSGSVLAGKVPTADFLERL